MKKKDVRQNLTALQPSLIQYNTTIPAVGDSSYAVIKNVQITGCSMCKEQDSHFCMKGTRFIYLSSNILLNHRKTERVVYGKHGSSCLKPIHNKIAFQ